MLCASFQYFLFRCDREDSFVYAWFVFVASSSSWTCSSSCGISGKMTATLDLTTIIAMLVALFYRFAAPPITCSSSLPNCHEPLTFVTLPSKPLFGYVTAFAQPLLIALLVAGEVEDCPMLDYVYVGISQYLLFN